MESFWASISFTLGVAITQPIYVSVSDVLGRKQPLYASIIFFTVGSIVFATAKRMDTLIAGRLVQGLGAGGLDVLEEIILADITSLKERPKYLGFIAMAIATGSILGPIVGGLFSEFVNWRWIGWINLPITGTVLVLSMLFLHLKPIELPFAVKIRRLDWGGMGLFIVGATATALPLSWAGALYPWSSWRTLVPLITGIIVLIILGFYEKGRDNAVFPYRVFSNRTSTVSLVTGSIHGLILYTILLYLPLFFEAVYLDSPLDAAKSTLCISFLVVSFSFGAPVIIEITRRYRILLWFGWIFSTVFLAAWTIVVHSTSKVESYVFQAMMGIGIGTVFTGTQVPMQASVTHVDDTGLAVGMLVAFRLIGGLVGLSISSAAFTAVFQQRISLLGPLTDRLATLNDANQAIAFIPTLRKLDLPAETMNGIILAYEKAFQAVWIILACFSGIGLLSSFFMEELTLETEDIGRQGFEQPR